MGWNLNRVLSSNILGMTVVRCWVSALFVIGLAGCASTTNPPAPVEERNAFAKPVPPAPAPTTGAVPVAIPSAAVTAAAPSDAAKPPLGIENAGKPGYYTVKSGDTLIRIGLETGQNWKDLLKWNNLENANLIEAGQVLRVYPPGADPSAVTTRPVATPKVEVRPLENPKPAASPSPSAAAQPSVPPAAAPVPPPAAPAATVAQGEDELTWQWPAPGSLIGGFDEARSKGLSIGGKAGDPVVAAADGKVVYAGSGLRGYGNLVILKHNNTYLSAYAHNQSLLVKEEQTVRRGQKIAEMGSTDSDKVQLHFEIRKQGKPIDPSRLLPSR